jgi:hypothetical protein
MHCSWLCGSAGMVSKLSKILWNSQCTWFPFHQSCSCHLAFLNKWRRTGYWAKLLQNPHVGELVCPCLHMNLLRFDPSTYLRPGQLIDWMCPSSAWAYVLGILRSRVVSRLVLRQMQEFLKFGWIHNSNRDFKSDADTANLKVLSAAI